MVWGSFLKSPLLSYIFGLLQLKPRQVINYISLMVVLINFTVLITWSYIHIFWWNFDFKYESTDEGCCCGDTCPPTVLRHCSYLSFGIPWPPLSESVCGECWTGGLRRHVWFSTCGYGEYSTTSSIIQDTEWLIHVCVFDLLSQCGYLCIIAEASDRNQKCGIHAFLLIFFLIHG